MTSRPDDPIRRRLPAGVVDAVFASLAAFIVGLVAVNVFSASELGAYAVFFAGFMLGTMVAYQLIYVPAEIAAAGLVREARLGVLRRSLLMGLPPSIVGTGAILLAALATVSITSSEFRFELAVSAWFATLVSPTQDHVRRLLHFRGWSWNAAAVSAVQLGTVGAAVVAMRALGISSGWIPFGSLAMANLASLSFGLIVVMARRGIVPLQETLRWRELVRTGGWLLVQGVLPMAAAFVSAWIITSLAGPEAMGYADAARVAAQPVLVLGMGLSTVLGPRAMEAALSRTRSAANRAVTVQAAIVAFGVAAYLLVAAGAYPWNPMRILIPKAYVVTGLVAFTVVVNGVIAVLFVVASELAAAGRQRLLASVSALGGIAQLVVSSSAGLTGAFARPLGLGASNAVRIGGYAVGRHSVYSAVAHSEEDPPLPLEDLGVLDSQSGGSGSGTNGNSRR